MMYAPIVVFAFNRPEHTERLFESLSRNVEYDDSPLIIYCDQAKNDKDIGAVNRTRDFVDRVLHPNKIVIKRQENWGLAKSIIHGVTQVLDQYGRIIVLEDDLILSPFFLQYMNDGLELYKDEGQVTSVTGYCFPVDGLPQTYLLKMTGCWGWGTWRRGWELFEPSGKVLLDELKRLELLDRFDLYGAFPYKRMLIQQMKGRTNSWAVRWYASNLVNDKFTVHPGKSLVVNDGFDGAGTHCGTFEGYSSDLYCLALKHGDIQRDESDKALSLLVKYFNKIKRSFIEKLFEKTTKILKL